jgi:ABC-type uncharacterized transport system ATPase subunit
MTTLTGALAAGLDVPADERVIDVRHLRMRYGSKDVLDGVTFSARRGEVLALLGPNGARYVHSAADATAFVRELFRQYGAGIADLEVRRAGLEDTYMTTVRDFEAGRTVKGLQR